MARPVPREDLLHLSPDPTRRARILESARFLVHLNDRVTPPGHVHPMTVKFQPVIDALVAGGPVILRTDQLVGLEWAEKLPGDGLWRVDTDGSVTPYEPEESTR